MNEPMTKQGQIVVSIGRIEVIRRDAETGEYLGRIVITADGEVIEEVKRGDD